MHCPSTGPERSLLVHPSQSHPSPRISFQLVAATKTQENKEEKWGRKGQRQGYTDIASTQMKGTNMKNKTRSKPRIWPDPIWVRCVNVV